LKSVSGRRYGALASGHGPASTGTTARPAPRRRPGVAHRTQPDRPRAGAHRPEVGDAAGTVTAQGYRTAGTEEPGTMDGADVLQVGDTVYAGRSGRTNDAGIEQLRALLEPLGARVVAVPVSKVLHLKSAVTALPDGTVIGYPPLLDDPGVFERFVVAEEEPGAHVVPLGDGRLLIAASAPGTAGAAAGARLPAGAGGHHRVREARGHGHLPVRPPRIATPSFRRSARRARRRGRPRRSPCRPPPPARDARRCAA
jgi:Arginine deiminase